MDDDGTDDGDGDGVDDGDSDDSNGSDVDDSDDGNGSDVDGNGSDVDGGDSDVDDDGGGRADADVPRASCRARIVGEISDGGRSAGGIVSAARSSPAVARASGTPGRGLARRTRVQTR
ncbi:MAG: hypothetical protein KF782_13775 [Labilithrix sp.]|nr:hypothetical protein [Labilithrix sp.]